MKDIINAYYIFFYIILIGNIKFESPLPFTPPPCASQPVAFNTLYIVQKVYILADKTTYYRKTAYSLQSQGCTVYSAR